MFFLHLFFNRDISRNTWVLCVSLVLFGFYYMTQGWLAVGGLMAAYAFATVATGQIVIKPNDPLEVALLTVWNKRYPFIITEGNKLLPRLFPFLANIIRVAVKRQTHRFVFEVEARSRNTSNDPGVPEFMPAGQLSVEIAIVGIPDYNAKNAGQRIQEYLKSGGEHGVYEIFKQMLLTAVRSVALTYSWNEFMSLKAPLQVALMTKLADSRMRKLPRVSENGPFAEGVFDMTDATYMRCEQVYDPFEYLNGMISTNLDEYKRRMREIEMFLKVAQRNGGGDIHHIGFLIQQLNVEDIKPLGDLAKVSDDSAVEDVQRVSEGKDFDTEAVLAEKYIEFEKKHGKEAAREAFERVRINRGRAKETIVRSSGNGVLDAAALFGNNNQK